MDKITFHELDADFTVVFDQDYVTVICHIEYDDEEGFCLTALNNDYILNVLELETITNYIKHLNSLRLPMAQETNE